MIKVGEVLVSDDAIETRFSCNVSACKGACCRVGNAGPPLADGEVQQVRDALPALVASSPERSRERIMRGEVFDRRPGKVNMACFEDGACVLSFPLPDGSVGCQLERAYRQKKTSFIKPRFCHLFPLTLESFYGQTVVNVERREECESGYDSDRGILEAFQEPLERVLGENWYSELTKALPAARAELAGRSKRRR